MSLAARALAWLTERIPQAPEYGARSDADPPVMKYTITDDEGRPYLTRVLLPRVLGVRPMIHHFHRNDGDREPHNHPWRWAASVVLAGSYVEERCQVGEEASTTRVVRRLNILRAGDFHRVSELRGDVWTLFLTGPRTQGWGFLTGAARQRFVEWRAFLDARREERAWEAGAADRRAARATQEIADEAWVADPVRDVEIEQFIGMALDGLGRRLGVRRKSEHTSDRLRGGVVESVMTSEGDRDYRARLARALPGRRAEAARRAEARNGAVASRVV